MTTKPSDLIAASLPFVGTVTFSAINDVIGIIAGIVGIAYLAWKWRREAKQKL
jgi:hypothetical protein